MDLTQKEIEKHLASIDDQLEKIDAMNSYAARLCNQDSDYTDVLINKALDTSRKLGYKKGIAQALLSKTIRMYPSGDYTSMLSLIDESEKIMRSLPEPHTLGLHRLLNGKALCCFYLGDTDLAAGLFKEAIDLCRFTGDRDLLGNIYANLSVLYDKLKDDEKALACCLEALEVLRDTSKYRILITTLDNAAIFSSRIGKYKEALAYLDRSYELIKKHNVGSQEAQILGNYADVFRKMGNYKEAELLMHKSLALSSSSGNKLQELITILDMGELYLDMEKPVRAEKLLVTYLERSKEYKIAAYDINVHKKLEAIYRQKGDFEKAHYHIIRYYELDKKDYLHSMDQKVKSIENDRLQADHDRIKIISTIGQEITSTLDMSVVLDLIYKNINSIMEAQVFGIGRIDKEQGLINFDLLVEQGQRMPSYSSPVDDPYSVASFVIKEKKDLIVNDAELELVSILPGIKEYQKARIRKSNNKLPQSLLCCPLKFSGDITGVIMIQSYEKNAYTISDLNSMQVLASYVAIALQNAGQAELIKQQNSELSLANAKLNSDIQLSRELQLAMIPSHFPTSPMYKIYGYFNFLDEVGGDLYDVYKISPDKTVVLILDVVGHGVSAALVTAMAKILFYNKAKEHLSAAQVVEEVNRDLTPITGESFTYFSLFFGIINSKDRTLQYVNASHPEPFLIKNNSQVSILSSSSLFIGLKEDVVYGQKVIQLENGDRLVLFTDGFFEIKGKNQDRFGEQRLLDTLLENSHLPPGKIIEKLNDQLKKFEKEENHDRTILIIDFF